MASIIIVWLFLLCSPIVALTIVKATKNKPQTRKKVALSFALLSALTILSCVVGISTTSETVNITLVIANYLTVSILLILLYHQKQFIAKFISGLLMLLIFGGGYMLSTIGILGLGLITMQYQPEPNVILSKNLILKQYNLGNAISYSRGIKIKIMRQYDWLPFVEIKILSKEYGINGWSYNKDSFEDYKLKINYDKNRQLLFLSDSLRTDTIQIK